MRELVVLAVLASQLSALLPFVRRVRRGEMPRVVDFACVSAVIFYGSGLASELADAHDSEFFLSLVTAPQDQFLWSTLLLFFLPWMLRLGDALVPRPPDWMPDDRTRAALSPGSRRAFFVVASLAAFACAAAGARIALSSDALWSARAEVGQTFGPYIIVLYLPLYVLGFFVSLREARTWKGGLFLFFLVLANAAATIGIAQRTLLLLPLVLIALFRWKITMTRLATVAGAGLLAAAILLPFFKWQYSDSALDVGELAASILSGDLDRSAVLGKAVELAEPVGSKVMRYPLEGYVYALAFYVPRSLFPGKGYSTAVYFTAHVLHASPESTDWGFGVGLLEEAVLNAGLWMALPLVCLLGYGMGRLDKLAQRIPTIVPASRLLGIFCCGYNVTAGLLLFGTMILCGVALHKLFAARPSLLQAAS